MRRGFLLPRVTNLFPICSLRFRAACCWLLPTFCNSILVCRPMRWLKRRMPILSASLLNAPQQVIALFRLPAADCNLDALTSQLTLVLDRVQDPGNLGTIVRIADWFGIRNIVCSCDTVDVFNPKTVQATMGALARVRVTYTDLVPFLKSLPDGFPVYGTFLEGDNIYQLDLPQKAIIVMGNEGNGISEEVERLVNSKLFIPSFPPNEPTSESLNVAVATAITCAEFRRRNF